MRMRPGYFFLVAAAAASAMPQAAKATFHFMQVEQVIGGVNGDTTAQAIQLRMRSGGQHLVSAARLRAWDAAGANPVLLIDITANLPTLISNTGDRILLATASFASHTTLAAVPDYVMTNPIPASYLAAGSLTFESDGGIVYWRLSWGGAAYTGSTLGDSTNDNDPGFGPADFGPPFGTALPSHGARALLFQGTATALSTTNAADYALTAGAAAFRNFAAAAFTVNVCMGAADCIGVACATGACFAPDCVFTPNHAACDNTVFCDGAETCNTTTGCRPGAPPCTAGQVCDEGTETCLNDCNGNGIDDAVDIANATSQDVNGNGIPDECEPLKNRFLSFVPTATSAATASAVVQGIKVTLVNLDPDSVTNPGTFNGQIRWAGPPTLNINDGVSGTFNAAQLQCAYHEQDWSGVGLLHVYGSAIVPASAYDVQMCVGELGPCSAALPVNTAKFGDIVPPLVTNQPNFQDIVSIVDKFQNKPNGPSKTRTKLREPVDPSTAVGFLEISTDVDAFQGKKFKQLFPQGPATCP